MSEAPPLIGQVITRLCDAGLSQLEIERRTGVPQPTLSRWSRGVGSHRADQALALQALLAQVQRDRDEEHRAT